MWSKKIVVVFRLCSFDKQVSMGASNWNLNGPVWNSQCCGNKPFG